MTHCQPGGTEPDFWSGRRVLVTGHTGFKGTWLTVRLLDMGARVLGLSLPGQHFLPSLWEATGLDIAEIRADLAGDGWWSDVRRFAPQVVFHLAAQSLVPVAATNPIGTYRSNVLGTANLLGALDPLRDSIKSILVITTDKVYDDAHSAGPYTEASILGASEPYAASKVGAEMVVRAWPTRLPGLATARSGNVIGGGDAAPRRLLPDLVRAWSRHEAATLRRPAAVRPWQHVCEPLDGYLRYVQHLVRSSRAPAALNFGPSLDQHATVLQCVTRAATAWERQTRSERPEWKVMEEGTLHETQELVLDSTLAMRALGWKGRWGWAEAIERTVAWHIAVDAGMPALEAIRRDWSSWMASPRA